MRVQVFQNYYREDQRSQLDPLFVPWDSALSEESEVWCEWALFRKLYQKGIHRNFNFLGAVSWKFRKKTGVQGAQLFHWLDEQPGYDVYFVNSHPFGELYQNIWWQLEQWHPGILSVGQYLIDRLGLDLNLQTWVQPRNEIAFSNFWFGSPFFWEQYYPFANGFYEYMKRPMPAEIRLLLDRPQPSGLSLRPYVMECAFPTLLGLAREEKCRPIRALRYQDPFEPQFPAAELIEKLKHHLRDHPSEVPKAYPKVHEFLKQLEAEISILQPH